jgi:phage repressor protein C with HTH and peptisase S24 domain
MIQKRIIEFLDFKGITKYKFYQLIGLSNGFLDKKGAIGSDNCEKICSYFTELNPSWLILGTGDMLIQKGYDATVHHHENSLVSEPQSTYGLGNRHGERIYTEQLVPLYNIEASAGIVSLFNDQSNSIPIGNIMIPELPYCDGAIYVAGDSMYPLLKSRDIVLFAKIPEMHNHRFLHGEIYIVTFENGGMYNTVIKWVHKSDEKGCVKLVSVNPNHSPTDILLESIKALAVVKGTVRINMN